MSILTTTALTNILDWLAANAPKAELASDSRRIAQGDAFFAYPGDEADGRNLSLIHI
mgnify:FL=1